jgi:hypothetical protein
MESYSIYCAGCDNIIGEGYSPVVIIPKDEYYCADCSRRDSEKKTKED